MESLLFLCILLLLFCFPFNASRTTMRAVSSPHSFASHCLEAPRHLLLRRWRTLPPKRSPPDCEASCSSWPLWGWVWFFFFFCFGVGGFCRKTPLPSSPSHGFSQKQPITRFPPKNARALLPGNWRPAVPPFSRSSTVPLLFSFYQTLSGGVRSVS